MPKRPRPTKVTIVEVQEDEGGDFHVWADLDGKELQFSIHRRGIISRKRHAGLGHTEVTVNALGEPILEEEVEEGDELDGILIFIEQMLDHWEDKEIDWHRFAAGFVDDDGITLTSQRISKLPASHKIRKQVTRHTKHEKEKPLRKRMPAWKEKRVVYKDTRGRTLGETGGRTWKQVQDSSTSEQHRSLKRRLAGLQGEESSETS